jgi:hypothetical protein
MMPFRRRLRLPPPVFADIYFDATIDRRFAFTLFSRRY